MPSFRGMRINRGQNPSAPPAGGPPPRPGSVFGNKPAPPPMRPPSQGSPSAPRGPQLGTSQKHNLAMMNHQSAIRDAQSIMRNNPVGSKAHTDASFAVRWHGDEMDRRQREQEAPGSAYARWQEGEKEKKGK